MIANNIASWAIFIPLAYLMPIQWGWGLPGFWWSDLAGEVFKVVVLAWAVSRVDWAEAAREAQARAGVESEASARGVTSIIAMSRASVRASKVD